MAFAATHPAIAAARVVVSPTCCTVCSRTLYRQMGEAKVCLGCSTVFEIGAQLWVCMDCGTARKYGDGRPEETSGKQLTCARCLHPTRHEFFEVSRGVKH